MDLVIGNGEIANKRIQMGPWQRKCDDRFRVLSGSSRVRSEFNVIPRNSVFWAREGGLQGGLHGGVREGRSHTAFFSRVVALSIDLGRGGT
jgi:hypothetical protein